MFFLNEHAIVVFFFEFDKKNTKCTQISDSKFQISDSKQQYIGSCTIKLWKAKTPYFYIGNAVKLHTQQRERGGLFLFF